MAKNIILLTRFIWNEVRIYMTDVLTKVQRHKNMQHIRGKDTHIEIILRKALWNEGIRYRKNYKAIPGSPDIAITKYRIAIFCDGEFFHGYNWDVQKARILRGDHGLYWVDKIEKNMERDAEKDCELEALGWSVIHFWGRDIKKHTDECVKAVKDRIFDMIMQGEHDEG